MAKLGPNLKEVVNRFKKKRFTLKTVIQIGLQIIDRLESLHEINYLHLDLKLENILLKSERMQSNESSKIVLIDFGLSKLFTKTETSD